MERAKKENGRGVTFYPSHQKGSIQEAARVKCQILSGGQPGTPKVAVVDTTELLVANPGSNTRKEMSRATRWKELQSLFSILMH